MHAGLDGAVWEEFNATHPIKILPVALDENDLKKVKKVLPGFVRFNWPPARTKLLTKPVPTIGFAEQLWVNPKLDAEVVYNITKAVSEKRKMLISLQRTFATVLTDPVKMAKYAQSDPFVPLHPSAERYYKEQGWLK